jgi:hypothetical protein
MDRPLPETERRPEMAKIFTCRRTPQGIAVMEDTMEHLSHSFHRAGKQYGQHSPEAWKVRVILAVIYSAAGDYEHVVSLLGGYVRVEKGKSELKPMWMVWAGDLLVEAYFNLGRIDDVMRIMEQGKSLARRIDPSAADPLLEALLEQAMALEAEGNLKRRERGFVVALLTLSWYVSHGFERSRADDHVKDQLRSLFDAYRISGDEWEWTVKHAHLTRYDFVGLLSSLPPHTGLAPKPLTVVPKRKPARTTRRAAQH